MSQKTLLFSVNGTALDVAAFICDGAAFDLFEGKRQIPLKSGNFFPVLNLSLLLKKISKNTLFLVDL